MPHQFALPTKTKRKRAWELWVCGLLFNGYHIHLFCRLKASMLPKGVKKKFKVEGHPILRKMEQDTGLLLPSDPSEINSAVIETNFSIGIGKFKNNSMQSFVVYK